jgi:hypothetical protein
MTNFVTHHNCKIDVIMGAGVGVDASVGWLHDRAAGAEPG